MKSQVRPRALTRAETMALLEQLSQVTDGDDAGATSAVTDALVTAMESIGVQPALVHAFRQTGMIVSEDNLDLWTPAELERWSRAVEEYLRPRRAGAAVPGR